MESVTVTVPTMKLHCGYRDTVHVTLFPRLPQCKNIVGSVTNLISPKQSCTSQYKRHDDAVHAVHAVLCPCHIAELTTMKLSLWTNIYYVYTYSLFSRDACGRDVTPNNRYPQ